MNIILGKVASIVDRSNFIITFTVDNYIDGQTAIPLMIMDEPVVGDEITLIELDSDFRSAYLYTKNKVDDFIRLRYNNKEISIVDDTISITTPKASITLDDSGNVNITSDLKVTIDAAQTTIEGIATPDVANPGGFCGLQNCIFSGAPHVSKTVVKT